MMLTREGDELNLIESRRISCVALWSKDAKRCVQGTVSSAIVASMANEKLINEDVGRGYVKGRVHLCTYDSYSFPSFICAKEEIANIMMRYSDALDVKVVSEI